jgi:hypothetical protein
VVCGRGVGPTDAALADQGARNCDACTTRPAADELRYAQVNLTATVKQERNHRQKKGLGTERRSSSVTRLLFYVAPEHVISPPTIVKLKEDRVFGPIHYPV